MLEPGDGPYHRANVSDGMDQPGLSIEENLQRIGSVPLSRPPGSGWGYSVGAHVLGEFIARAAQSSLPALVKKLVTGVLGMSDTDFTVVDRTAGSPIRELSVVVLTNTAVSGMLGPFPDAVRDAIYGSITR